MALTKSLALPTGVVVTYWRLESADMLHLARNKVILTYMGYLDEAAFDDGKPGIIEKSIEISLSDLSGVADALNSYSYDDLSALLDEE